VGAIDCSTGATALSSGSYALVGVANALVGVANARVDFSFCSGSSSGNRFCAIGSIAGITVGT